ncbi:MAG: glycosyltransferase family 39 protein [Thermoguttaceae bacterium]
MTTTSGSPAPLWGSADWCRRWILVFLAVGVAARLIRYLLRFPLWGDEAMLATNFLDRDYAGLMQPLDFHQVAPLLFLWIELTAVKLLGFHEWSLRLFPLLCSIASLFLFHRLARLLLHGTALVLAIGIFAVTYSGLRYAAEVKPYGVDLMVSTLLLLLVARWWQQPDDTRWLWVLAAVVPLALGLSYPAVFVAGGASLAVATVLLGTRSRRGWWVWAAYNMVLAGSFLAWYRFAIGTQAGAELEVMGRMWDETFPPRDSLIKALVWLVKVHAGPLLAVPVGGDHWGSIGTTLICLAAVGVLIHQGRYRLLVLCSAPFALNLIAAEMRRFPYGGHMRLAMHLAPLVCILAAIGATAVLKWLSRNRSAHGPLQPAETDGSEPLTWPVATAIAALLMLAVLSTARDFCHPGKEQQEIRKRDFAVWFWGSMEREHEVVCVSSDLKRTFPPPGDPWENCVSPQFLCNQRIYSPQRSRGQGHDFSRVSRQRPLACVQYWSHFTPYDQAAFDRWLDEMKQCYDLIAMQCYPMLQDNDYDRVPEPPDRVEVYEFVPRW